jgi:ribosome-associated protein
MLIHRKIKDRAFDGEFHFLTSRSSGPGGQHVNKTNSKVQLLFSIPNSLVLDEVEKDLLLQKLASKIDTEGKIMIQAQESKSQKQNKELTVRKFYDLISKAFAVKKVRKIAKPSKGAIEERLKEKKVQSQKKQARNFKSEH